MPKLIEKLGNEPITLEEAKVQCYIDPSHYDTDIDIQLSRLILSARSIAESRTWQGLRYGKYEHRLRGFPRGEIEIPKPPLHEVEQVTYMTDEGMQTLSSDLYYVDAHSTPGLIGPVSDWPQALDRPGSVVITYKGGYLAEETEEEIHKVIPENIKAAMLIIIKFLFDHRDATVPDKATPMNIPRAALDLLDDASSGVVA